MIAPVNVRLANPTIILPDWHIESGQWIALNDEIGGNPNFFPLTIKAAYVIGIIHDICESVTCLLQYRNTSRVTYIPAYGVFASGVEVLGRCINGNSDTRNNVQDIRIGFKWLVSSSPDEIPNDHVVMSTPSFDYTVNMLIALRHFAAHGQATTRTTGQNTYQFGGIDYDLLNLLRPCLADGLERYWGELQRSDDLCNALASANIIAFRSWPVFKSWSIFEINEGGNYESISEIFNKFDWRI